MPEWRIRDSDLHGFLLSGGLYTPIDVPGAVGTIATGITLPKTSWAATKMRAESTATSGRHESIRSNRG